MQYYLNNFMKIKLNAIIIGNCEFCACVPCDWIYLIDNTI